MSINYFINQINNNNLGYNSYEYFLRSNLLKLNQKNYKKNVYIISNGYFPKYIAQARSNPLINFEESIKNDIDWQFEIAKNRIALSDYIIYFYPYEPFEFENDNYVFEYIKNKCKNKPIKFIINNNKIRKKDYIHFDFFRYDFYSVKKQFETNNTDFIKTFLFLNNKKNQTREKLYEFIINNKSLENNSFYSFLFKNKSLDNIAINKNFQEISNGRVDFFKTHSRFLQDDYLSNNIREYFEKTFVYIITESKPEIDFNFLTEKTYKAFYHGIPFLMIGPAKSLEYLKKIGFKTFDKWFDESYDDEIDLNIRTNKIYNEINRINLLPKTELSKIKNDMFSILKHNNDIYLNNLNDEFSNFFKNMIL